MKPEKPKSSNIILWIFSFFRCNLYAHWQWDYRDLFCKTIILIIMSTFLMKIIFSLSNWTRKATNQINLTIFYPQTIQPKFVIPYSSDLLNKKLKKSLDMAKIFDRRRKIRKHGCKYLSLIGPSSSYNELVTSMLVTHVGDKMLVTDLKHWKNHQHNEKPANKVILSPTS